MKVLKRIIFVSFIILITSLIFSEFLTKFNALILILGSIFLLLIDEFFKNFVNKNIISIFTDKDFQSPNWIIKTSDFFISLACILFAYRLGLDINNFTKLKYVPPIELFKNLDLLYSIIAMILCATLTNILWSIFARLKRMYVEVNNEKQFKRWARPKLKLGLYNVIFKFIYRKHKIK